MSNKEITNTLSDFKITQRWPAEEPQKLQLYTMPTPNGQKVSIMLEEIGLEYEAHKVPLNDQGVTTAEFLSLNPNNKIPAIIDPNGPNGNPLALFESGAILVYLAEKTNKLIGCSEEERYEILQWVMFQMGGLGPMFGQLGFFYAYAGKDIEDKRPLQRYVKEAKRLLNVVDKRLEGRNWLVNDYSIADIATVPWLNSLISAYNAAEILNLNSYKNVCAYMDRFNARPAVQQGKDIPPNAWD